MSSNINWSNILETCRIYNICRYLFIIVIHYPIDDWLIIWKGVNWFQDALKRSCIAAIVKVCRHFRCELSTKRVISFPGEGNDTSILSTRHSKLDNFRLNFSPQHNLTYLIDLIRKRWFIVGDDQFDFKIILCVHVWANLVSFQIVTFTCLKGNRLLSCWAIITGRIESVWKLSDIARNERCFGGFSGAIVTRKEECEIGRGITSKGVDSWNWRIEISSQNFAIEIKVEVHLLQLRFNCFSSLIL